MGQTQTGLHPAIQQGEFQSCSEKINGISLDAVCLHKFPVKIVSHAITQHYIDVNCIMFIVVSTKIS